jgi:hypothetical protein
VLAAATRLELRLAALAGALAVLDGPAGGSFAVVISRAEPVATDPAVAAEWAIALVHSIFEDVARTPLITVATKRVGNAARGLRRALAREAARDASIALREATPLPVKKGLASKLAA